MQTSNMITNIRKANMHVPEFRILCSTGKNKNDLPPVTGYFISRIYVNFDDIRQLTLPRQQVDSLGLVCESLN